MTDLLRQAIAAHQTNDLVTAERLYRAALTETPQRADAYYNLGTLFGQQGRAVEAMQSLQEAVRLKPDFGEAWFMLCEFADQKGRQDLNVKAGAEATRLLPDNARAWLRYGLALSRLGRDEEAVAAYRKAMALDPALPSVSVNLSVVLKNLNCVQEAEEVLRKAIDQSGQKIADENGREVDEGEYGPLYWNLALAELALGKYREGFAHFRVRFRHGTNWRRLDTDKPLWRGEDLRGKTILVSAEMGHGDALMMARYLPLLKACGATVLFLVHPALVPYLTGWEGADKILTLHQPMAEVFDYHTSVFDLPHVFGHGIEAIPVEVPYLPVPDVDMLAQRDGRLAVGVIWAGPAENLPSRGRSVPLQNFAELFHEKDVQFFSLTRDMRPGDKELLSHYPVTDLAPSIGSFADSAKLMTQMDLIITCDSGPAHLAGGMGLPVWTLLPFAADWRWGLEGENSSWYPTMRLFRQRRPGDWTEVLLRVRSELRKAAASWSNKGNEKQQRMP